MDIHKYIYQKENAISLELCKEIIELYESMPNKYFGHTASGIQRNIKNTIDYNIPIKSSKWATKYEYDLWKNISNLLLKTLNNNIEKYLNDISMCYEYPNYKNIFVDTLLMHKYESGCGEYKVHTDNECKNLENNIPVDRIVTFIFYINDVYEGGETEIWKNTKIIPKAGKLLLFPACWTFPHAGKMPISNNNYIITGWFYKMN